MTGPQDSLPDAVLKRAILLLESFTSDDICLTPSEIARRTGLARSTVYRLAGQLEEGGLLERDGGQLRLSLRLFELGQLVPQQRSLREIATPYMANLREATRQTVNLCVLEGRDIIYVEILRGPGTPSFPSRVGGRFPAHSTGAGKAILAFDADSSRLEAMIDAGLRSLTKHTITDPEAFVDALRVVRQNGIAFDREEGKVGVHCVASPVLGKDGTALGALSITGHSELDLERYALSVRATALHLTRLIRETRILVKTPLITTGGSE